MQIICISRGTFSGGKDLAENLAERLDYACLSREELIDSATKEGIPVGKLEMAMVRPGVFSQRLALERDHYSAFSTAFLCDKITESDGLVYHGRTGHLLLAGVRHVLRVRVLADEEQRIRTVMQNLGLDRDKARKYLREVDEDRKRWVYSMYGVSWEDAANYDLVLNLAFMNLENATSALVNVAQLPDFQMTPAARKVLEDLHLAARARLALARDERTHWAGVKVRADKGVVTVTYLPQDAKVAEFIPAVCRNLPDLKEVRATMAMTNLLWIQEEFRPNSGLYEQVLELATKWNAAVELIRLAPEGESPQGETTMAEPAQATAAKNFREYNGGIEDESSDLSADDGGLKQTLDELAKVGKSGGGRVVYGGQSQLINAIDRSMPYTLVVIGEVFKSKGHAAMLRITRDLRNFLGDRIKAPVVTADELGSHYLFGKRDIIQAGVFLGLTVLLYFLVFTYEEPILAFLAQAGWYAEACRDTFLAKADWGLGVIVSIVVFIITPIVAYFYGSVIMAALKLIKME